MAATVVTTTDPMASARPSAARWRRFVVAFVALVAALAASLVGSPTASAAEKEHQLFVSVASGLVLDVHYDIEVFAAERNGSDTQRWLYEFRSDGALAIRNVGTGRCLEVPYGSNELGLGVIVWDCNGNDNQAWNVTAVTDQFFALTNAATGLALELPANATGTRVVQQPLSGNDSQQWGFGSPAQQSDGSEAPVAQDTPAAKPTPESPILSEAEVELIGDAFNDVGSYWRRTIGEASSAELVVFDGAVEWKCTGSPVIAAYCKPDDTIALSAAATTAIVDGYGGFALAYVIATTYASNVQYELGLSPAGKNFELQADCFAGAWAADANRRGRLAPSDFNNALELAGTFKGETTGQERTNGALAGWMNGPQYCVDNFR